MASKLLSYSDQRDFDTKGEGGVSNAGLGRAAATAIERAIADDPTKAKTYKYLRPAFVNKTEKYISCKFNIDHLTDEEKQKAEQLLREALPNRFLKITNSTANTGGRGFTWQEPKVLVRFTQKAPPVCSKCGTPINTHA